MQRRKNLIIIVHSCCFYINWLVTPGLKKGSCVHESHFPNKLCCESNVVLERSRLITELIQKGCRALFILSLLHFKAMEMEPLSPLYYSCIQRDWNGSHTILVWPWAALSYPPEILPQSLKKGRKEQDFLNFFFFLIAESITLSFIPVSKSSAFYVGSVGINLKVLVRSTGRHSCKSTRTCKSPQRAVRAWLSVVKCKIIFFFFFFQMYRSSLSLLKIQGSFLKSQFSTFWWSVLAVLPYGGDPGFPAYCQSC